MKLRRFNWIISDLLRKALKRYFEWSARLKGQRFYCRALGGESDYNLTINCDLTVSCNCQDYDGSGHIGNLNKNSFKEVFFGPVARRFREELAKGKQMARGRILMRMEDTRSIAGWLGSQELLTNTILTADEVVDRLEAVTIEDVLRVGAELLKPELATLAAVGPFEDDRLFGGLI